MRCRRVARIVVVVAGAGWATALGALDYRATAPDVDAQFAAMTELYEAACLNAFPDDAAVAAIAAAHGGTAMADADVRARLHDDPGHGWFVRAAGATFDLTVEHPPYHACAVRTMTSDAKRGPAFYWPMMTRYRGDRPFEKMPGIAQRLGNVMSVGHAMIGTDAKGVPTIFSVFINFVEDRAAAAANGQTASEIRFVRSEVGMAKPAT